MFKRLWNWLRQNWEPMVAILALALSVWTAWANKVSIDLTQASIDLTRQSQMLAVDDYKIRNRPFLYVKTEIDAGRVSIVNYGNGPAYLYRIVLLGPNNAVLSVDDDNINVINQVNEFRKWAFSALAPQILSDSGRSIKGFLPIGPIAGGAERTILQIGKDVDPSADGQGGAPWWNDITVQGCYIAMYSKTVIALNGSEEICAPIPLVVQEKIL